jgi:hypothetical protein
VVQPGAEHFQTATVVLGSQAIAATKKCTRITLLTKNYTKFTPIV